MQQPVEKFLAELTEAAYGVALAHGLRGSFLEVELELWAALRKVVDRRCCSEEARAWAA